MTPRPPAPATGAAATGAPGFGEAARFWLRLGFISFGGPTGQIALLHEELVERRKWVDEARFLHALNYCLLLPGPEAQQLATYCGWMLHGTRGAIVAGSLFVLPAAVLLYLLSWLYVLHGHVPAVAGALAGLQPAVLALIAAAAVRLGRRTLRTPARWTLAGLSLVAVASGRIPFPVLIAAGLVLGWLGGRFWPGQFAPDAGPASPSTPSASTTANAAGSFNLNPAETRRAPGARRTVVTILTWLGLWWVPVLATGLWLGGAHRLTEIGVFFSKASLLTFGGAYAILPYVSQQAVTAREWLTAADMFTGLGLAETTPGPLIIVLQFVGFLAGWHEPAPLGRGLAATLGAALTTWTTFVPSFLWILAGAPHVEHLRRFAWLNHALAAVTAVVIGVILHLGLWFGRQVLWRPEGLDGIALGMAVVVFLGLWRWRWPVAAVIPACALGGWLRTVAGWT